MVAKQIVWSLKNYNKGHCGLSSQIFPQLIKNFSSMAIFPCEYIGLGSLQLNCMNVSITGILYIWIISLSTKLYIKTKQPKYNTTIFGYRSSIHYGSKLWNSLPIVVKYFNSVQEFSTKISKCCFTISPNGFDILRLILLLYKFIDVFYYNVPE